MKQTMKQLLVSLCLLLVLCNSVFVGADSTEPGEPPTDPDVIAREEARALGVRIDAALALKALHYAVGKNTFFSSEEWLYLDATADGTVDAYDALAILRVSIHKDPLSVCDVRSYQVLETVDYPAVRMDGIEYGNPGVALCRTLLDWQMFYGLSNLPTQSVSSMETLSVDFFKEYSLLAVIDRSGNEAGCQAGTLLQRGRTLLLTLCNGGSSQKEQCRLFLLTIPKTEAETMRVRYEEPPVYTTPAVQFFNGVAPCLFDGVSYDTVTISNADALQAHITSVFDVEVPPTNAASFYSKLTIGMAHRLADGFYDRYVTVICRVRGVKGAEGYRFAGMDEQGTIRLTKQYLHTPPEDPDALGGILYGDELVFIDLPRSDSLPASLTVEIL